MAEFIIQGTKLENGTIIPAQDYGYTAIEAINFDQWYHGDKRHSFQIVEFESFDSFAENKNVIPIGSVEFVQSYFSHCHGIECVRPLNIPRELEPFANRKIEKLYGITEVSFEEDKIVKSMTGIKKFCSLISAERGTTILPKDDYVISDLLDIESEWRCFVYRGKLIDAKCYSYTRTPFCIPDRYLIIDMIRAYKSSPTAYTLDVCVDLYNKTSILEVHNFFSCGLYGFNDYEAYLSMIISGIRWQIDQSREFA
jgi:hypothetical protein